MPVDDGYTVSLLHFDPGRAASCTDENPVHVWTERGNAQQTLGQYVFGGSSEVFDGTGDYIDTPDSADWRLDGGSNSNKWTIDFRLRFNGDPGTATVGLVQQYAANTDFWSFYLSNNALFIHIRSASTNIVSLSNAWNPATATWYHVACVKDGTNGYMMFVDGSQVGSTQTDTDPMPDFNGALRIGRHTGATGVNSDLNGWIDEFRISKGVARWTANFTPPTRAYFPGRLLGITNII